MDDPRGHVTGLITALFSTPVVYTAASLKLFDAMDEGLATSAELAERTATHPPSVFRLLRALAALELVNHEGGNRFALTDAGRFLRAGAPDSVRGMALHWGERIYGALGQLTQSVKTGEPWKISGLEGFQQMASDPAGVAMFHQSMADQAAPVGRMLVEAYDFSGVSTVLDVGGSLGALLAEVLKANPKITGQVLDLPALAEPCAAYLQQRGVGERAGFIGGSFFNAVPSGFDAYLIKSIVHDWQDAEARVILERCRAAMAEGARVLVIEQIAPERVRGAADLPPIRGDIMMMTANGGRERTEGEFRELFASAGLKLDRIVPTRGLFSVLEGSAA